MPLPRATSQLDENGPHANLGSRRMTTTLGPAFDAALDFASRTHATQRRKGPGIPYIAHLLGVCALVLEDRGSEAEAIAALLHDAPEDQGGKTMLNEIRSEFGDEVAEIVAGCTDAFEMPKPPWRERKEAFIARLPGASASVLRVANADKLNNARAILADYEDHGEDLWQRFRGRREGTLWYYRTLAELFTERAPGPMARELSRVVGRFPS
jgi:(p)ppGpp synthase/HD superfamily hydrolase